MVEVAEGKMIRKFIWLGWVHQEQPPWGLGRIVFMRSVSISQQAWLDRRRRNAIRWAVFAFAVAALVVGLMISGAHARDLGQWEAGDPAVRQWYQTLMRPDAPSSSCCGEADAYWADTVHVKGGKTFATITDDRPDGPLGRPHIDVGTVIEVPNEKLKWDRGNPTGHNVLFVSKGLYAWCFVQGSGI